jgi:O-acetyl-ADP-ribose deacetylase (regulator of RNase III)
MPFTVVYGDLLAQGTDALVNAANTSLAMGGGVCGAIFRAAGPKELAEACRAVGGCPVGQAVVTPGFKAARLIIHAVGPVWAGGQSGEPGLLASCYANSLSLALANGCRSVAFPLISAGIYGYPKPLAQAAAEKAIKGFLAERGEPELDARLVLRKQAGPFGRGEP